MKILLVSWSILPQAGGSSIIVENLAQNFDRSEMLVLGSTAPFRSNEFDRQGNTPAFLYFLSDLYFFGRGYRYFEWFRKWRFQPLVNKIKNIIRDERIDRVIGVYPNPFYCRAACLAARAMNIPFYAYFHNTYVENTAISDPAALEIQNEIFDHSRLIFVMSKGMQQFYSQKYPAFRGKFIPLVHTFSEYPPRNELSGIPGAGKREYKLVAIGNFNESNMDATRRIANAVKNSSRYSLSLYTHVPKLLLQKRGLDVANIDHRGFLPPDQVHKALQNYDICVLPHGFTGNYGEIEYRTIFPTRTIPLLLSGKPILAHSPPGAFLTDFITENQCAAIVSEADEAAIIRSLDRIADDENYQRELVRNAGKTAGMFYGPAVARQLRTILSEVAPEKQP